jgi:hypothetical protein
MKFILGIAGIPHELYDEVLKQKLHICSGDDSLDFISRPLRPNKSGQLAYSKSDSNYYLGEFASRFSADDHNRLCDTGLALIYINYATATTALFAESLFPSVLAVPVAVNFPVTQLSKQKLAETKNYLVELLRNATTEIKNAIPPLKKEITEHDSRTPLLLPIKNFESDILIPQLRGLQVALLMEHDKILAVDTAIKGIAGGHPLTKQLDNPQKRCFVDDRKIEFHPPGSARHAFARPNNEHPASCLLSGRRRLGAPYDHAFHYDCIKGKQLTGQFWGCHEDRSTHVGKPHLNIAPNDYVR